MCKKLSEVFWTATSLLLTLPPRSIDPRSLIKREFLPAKSRHCYVVYVHFVRGQHFAVTGFSLIRIYSWIIIYARSVEFERRSQNAKPLTQKNLMRIRFCGLCKMLISVAQTISEILSILIFLHQWLCFLAPELKLYKPDLQSSPNKWLRLDFGVSSQLPVFTKLYW